MSVTVEDILKLPSLRNAEVVAGKGGLGKIVSSVSVLEATDPKLLNDALFDNSEFYGSEIVITGFLNTTENVELQKSSIRRLAEGGEVGLILYYVGVYLKEIDKSLIKLADELDFALICMPKNRVDLRYSEVICDVMGAIIKDQLSSSSLTVELLERVAKLPQHQQTVDTVVKMLSDRLRATVILTDSRFSVLNEAAWPRELGGAHEHIKDCVLPAPYGEPVPFPWIENALLYRAQVFAEDGQSMELFIIQSGEPFPKSRLQQAAESIHLAVSLWSQHHQRALISELVKAILQDEPLKMRRLAEVFHIDIACVHVMWIYSGSGLLPEMADAAAKGAAQYCKTVFADIYDGSLVVFMDGEVGAEDAHELSEMIASLLPEDTVKTVFTGLENTGDVREAFLANREHLGDARIIMPQKSSYSGNDVFFAMKCRERISGGELAANRALYPLEALGSKRDAAELSRTLETFLLDCGCSVTETAKRLFVHKNTVKYRLKSMGECFGFAVGSMPASYMLYEAVSVKRLLECSKH